jgi:apolipoprotein N-acyltransferase
LSAARPPRLLARAEQARLAISGALLALAFPPLPLGLLSLVALVPLLEVLDEDPRPGFRRGFLRGAFFGSVFYLALLFWLWDLVRFTPLIVPIWVLSCLYLGSVVGLATGAVQWVRARTGRSPALFLPFAWIGLEKLLQYGDLRFTWGVLADALTPYPLLLQSAEVWGALGISFLIVCANGLVYALWKRRGDARARRRAGLALALLAGLVLAYGLARWSAYPAADPVSASGKEAPLESSHAAVRIAVIQPNIPQEARDDPDRDAFEKSRLFALSRRALGKRPDLVVWPETAASWLRYDLAYFADLVDLCCGRAGAPPTGAAEAEPRVEPRAGTPFLVGALDAVAPGTPDQRVFNAAFLIGATGELAGDYRKVLLVPMTEQVPFSGMLGFLKPERWAGSFTPGEGFLPLSFQLRRPSATTSARSSAAAPTGGSFQSHEVKVGIPICYEIIFPQAIRGFRQRGARLIVTITNDAWFGRTPAPFQHFSQLRLRAIENRIAIARSANTGISGFVSARGDVLGKTAIFEPAFLVEELPLAGPPSPYTRWGDWILPASWAGLASFLLIGARRDRH